LLGVESDDANLIPSWYQMTWPCGIFNSQVNVIGELSLPFNVSSHLTIRIFGSINLTIFDSLILLDSTSKRYVPSSSGLESRIVIRYFIPWLSRSGSWVNEILESRFADKSLPAFIHLALFLTSWLNVMDKVNSSPRIGSAGWSVNGTRTLTGVSRTFRRADDWVSSGSLTVYVSASFNSTEGIVKVNVQSIWEYSYLGVELVGRAILPKRRVRF
jgi:hypothetical protein